MTKSPSCATAMRRLEAARQRLAALESRRAGCSGRPAVVVVDAGTVEAVVADVFGPTFAPAQLAEQPDAEVAANAAPPDREQLERERLAAGGLAVVRVRDLRPLDRILYEGRPVFVVNVERGRGDDVDDDPEMEARDVPHPMVLRLACTDLGCERRFSVSTFDRAWFVVLPPSEYRDKSDLYRDVARAAHWRGAAVLEVPSPRAFAEGMARTQSNRWRVLKLPPRPTPQELVHVLHERGAILWWQGRGEWEGFADALDRLPVAGDRAVVLIVRPSERRFASLPVFRLRDDWNRSINRGGLIRPEPRPAADVVVLPDPTLAEAQRAELGPEFRGQPLGLDFGADVSAGQREADCKAARERWVKLNERTLHKPHREGEAMRRYEEWHRERLKTIRDLRGCGQEVAPGDVFERRPAVATPSSGTIYLPTADRAALLSTVREHRNLFERFDERRLLAGGYTDEELRSTIATWVMEDNEADPARPAAAPPPSAPPDGPHTLPLEQVLVTWRPVRRSSPTPALRSLAADKQHRVFHWTGNAADLSVRGSVSFMGERDEKSRDLLRKVQAAQRAGYQLRAVKLGGRRTTLLVRPDSKHPRREVVLTPAGAAALLVDDFGPVEVVDAGADHERRFSARRLADVRQLVRWLATLPASTLGSASALSRKLGQHELGRRLRFIRSTFGGLVLEGREDDKVVWRMTPPSSVAGIAHPELDNYAGLVRKLGHYAAGNASDHWASQERTADAAAAASHAAQQPLAEVLAEGAKAR